MSFFRRPIRKIAIVSIPTAGHIKPLIRLAQELKRNEENISLTFILTSWNGYNINTVDKEKLKEVSDQLTILEAINQIFSTNQFKDCYRLIKSDESATLPFKNLIRLLDQERSIKPDSTSNLLYQNR